jgi:DNA processing protein
LTDRLELALTAFEVLRTPSRITGALRAGGTSALEAEYTGLAANARVDVDQKAHAMREHRIDAVFFGMPDYPSSLVSDRHPVAPIIFYRGNKELFYRDGIGMCGSRHVSDRGVEAASRCGRYATEMGLTVVSGYAAGVDTATHLAALREGGSTVVVLAEGMDFFRVKRAFAADFDWDRILVVSQFPPSQPWRAHAAMARNAIIFGLPKALLVVEAGERGGTLAAGKGALKLGRSVIAVDFGDETPPGNRILIEKGARAVRTPPQLRAAFYEVRSADPVVESPTLF